VQCVTLNIICSISDQLRSNFKSVIGLGSTGRKGLLWSSLYFMLKRQRPLFNEHSAIDPTVNEIDRKLADFKTEHKPARRHQQGITVFKRRLRRGMLFAVLCTAIYVVYLRVQVGEAAQYNWNKQVAWKPSWYVICGSVLMLVQTTATMQLQGIRHLRKASPTCVYY
jgi:hypothetical protein